MNLIRGMLLRISSRNIEQDLPPTDTSTNSLTGEIADHVFEIAHSESNRREYSPFPEGMDEADIPDVVRDSWKKVQEHGLSPEKQSKISYYEKNGEWFIDIDGTKISMHNESAAHNPAAGIIVEKGNTYFSQSAARIYAQEKRQSIPTNSLWQKMANFLGGFAQLKDILQIPSAGWFSPRDNDFRGRDLFATVWSNDDRGYLDVGTNNDGYTSYVSDDRHGLSLRLLDRFGDSSYI